MSLDTQILECVHNDQQTFPLERIRFALAVPLILSIGNAFVFMNIFRWTSLFMPTGRTRS